ncbi:MAG: helicase-related protein [Verrucomicrobiota bacterium JB023]|nr:helicase-related protein [Verrucomicrobiota bacterium JB023]
MSSPREGQRWISTSEPKLGLGLVLEVDGRQIELVFPAAEEVRRFALATAPLVRVKFKAGDVIESASGDKLVVERVEEDSEGLLTYHGRGGGQLDEADLLDTLSFTSPEDRLLAGITDDFRQFDFRAQALEWNTRLRGSLARGFTGARIDLIPHQFAIVAEAARRLNPRLLLADEVGLGKTIEACLILHHLHLTGRADRVLVLVPEPLVHQWFVELYRRFNLLFALFDEGRAVAIENSGKTGDEESVNLLAEIGLDDDGGQAVNPFLDSQLILCATEFLVDNPQRARQAREAGFDLLVVDEAHHLEWHPGEPSEEYEVVESLAREVSSLLLLTATPQQLGPEGHFARLRLLDPDRYSDLEEFAKEAESYGPLAKVVESLADERLPEDELIEPFLKKSERARRHWEALKKEEAPEVARALQAELVDLFGTGRVLFRNTRDRLEGFPKRRLVLAPLEEGESTIQWLADLLRKLGDEKVLLITHSLDGALRIQEKLLERIGIETAVFHEEMGMVERDRQAAWFSDPDGARILICSQIGSEGRNFQFAHHLVLFDLPRNPEVLEQRIGRLDRIGQSADVNIHVPYVKNSSYEILARWLSEGLGAFEAPLKGAATLAAELSGELEEYIQDPGREGFEDFLTKSRERRDEVAAELASGHDRLLALGAPSPERAGELLEAIDAADGDRQFEGFALRLFDQLGLDVEDMDQRNFLLKRGQRLSETFADLPQEGLAITFDREEANFREDLTFLTADHPTFRTALEQILAGEGGNSTFAHLKNGKGKAVYLQCSFVFESLAPARLHVERFLPPTSIRVMVDHASKERRPEEVIGDMPLKGADVHKLVSQDSFRQNILPALLGGARQLAEAKSQEAKAVAAQRAEQIMGEELKRLEDLASRNPQVTEEEVAGMRAEFEAVREALENSRLRLDSLRLIWQS